MIGILVICHEPLATALLKVARHIHKRLPSQLAALDVVPGEDEQQITDAARHLLSRINDGSGALILTDLNGSMPSLVATTVTEPGRIVQVSDVNMPMLMKALMYRGKPSIEVEELATRLDATRMTIEETEQVLEMALVSSESNTELRLPVKRESSILKRGFLSFIGDFIEQDDHSKNIKMLEALLRGPLGRASVMAGYPENKQEAFLAKVIDSLLHHDIDESKTWAAKVQGERQTDTTERALPETAPATWKADKQPGDTPPDFIKRHYGPWLRQDGLGLSKADIRRLDASLYMGLLNWLRPKANGQTNVLPSDCPLPTLAERNTHEIEQLGADELKAAERLAWVRRSRER